MWPMHQNWDDIQTGIRLLMHQVEDDIAHASLRRCRIVANVLV